MPVEIKEMIIRAVIGPKKEEAQEQGGASCAQSPHDADIQEAQIRNLRQMINDKNER